MPQLDGDHSKGKLLFKCGTVLDFDTGVRRKAVPEDRLGHCMGCDATDFKVPSTPIFEDIEHWIEPKESSDDAKTTKDKLWQRIVEQLKELSKNCDVLRVLCNFAGSWEGVIWLLRTIARMATGNPRICEFLYLFGPGSSGKDVAMLLILTFFGAAEENYGCVLNGKFLVDGPGSSKEGASPFLASTVGKRFVWVSEVPQHSNLQVDMIKQFCEQSGAPLAARKLYKAPISFRPIGVICATSNFPPQVKDKDDSGYVRRARIWQTTQTFATKPKLITEVRADPAIKQNPVAPEDVVSFAERVRLSPKP